ncbi:MAG: RluA family pseudouridine synthase [Cytophagales bacterium]|nr:RluA family pseudouridine synthase [Cytophagales bacterium]
MTEENSFSVEEPQEEGSLFEHHRIVADPNQQMLRVDKFLMDRVPNVTRNKVQTLIKDGFVQVNEASIKSNYKVKPNDVVTIKLLEPPRNEELIPEDIPLNIIYEDDELLIVNKEAGMVVHPAHNNWSGTLVNALAFHFDNLPTSRNGEIRPGLVHRIDKDTSGLLVIAKTENAMTKLAKQFFDHTVERTYYALVWGDVKENEGTITGHIGRSLKNRKVMSVFPDGEYGKHAVSHYKVLKRFDYTTLVQCNLETGRTHQIRAHFKHIGHPLFNDSNYGGDKVRAGEVFTKYKQFVENTFKMVPRQALHAKTLGFIHPTTGKFMQFDSELPEDLSGAIERWEKYISTRG